MAFAAKLINVQESKQVHCEVCRSILTVRSDRQSANDLHRADCPLRYIPNVSGFHRRDMRNVSDSEPITESDIEEILSVVDVYPPNLCVTDVIQNHISDEDTSHAEISDESDMIEGNNISRTVQADSEGGTTQAVPRQDVKCTGYDTAISTKGTTKEFRQILSKSVSSCVANAPEQLPPVDTDTISDVNSHICPAPLFLGMNIPSLKERKDLGEPKYLHDSLQHMKRQSPEEGFPRHDGSVMKKPDNEGNVKTKGEECPRNRNGGGKEGVKDQDKGFDLMADIENLAKRHSRMRADTPNRSKNRERNTDEQEDSAKTIENDP